MVQRAVTSGGVFEPEHLLVREDARPDRVIEQNLFQDLNFGSCNELTAASMHLGVVPKASGTVHHRDAAGCDFVSKWRATRLGPFAESAVSDSGNDFRSLVNVIEGLSVNHVSVDRRPARNCFGFRLHPDTERYSAVNFNRHLMPVGFIGPSKRDDLASS
jgi:hypothetical protein